MISGADDRLALVITSEAQLDGIVAARAQVTGLGADTERSAVQMAAASRANAEATSEQTSGVIAMRSANKELGASTTQVTDSTRAMTVAQIRAIEINDALGASTVAGTKNMSMFAALQAEATGGVGKHSLALGRLERNLSGVAGRALGVSSSVDLMGSSLLKFGIGSIETVGILAGIAAITAAYDLLTNEQNKVKASATDLAHLESFTAATMPAQLAAIRAGRDAAIGAATTGAGDLTSDQGFFRRMLHMREAGKGLKEDIMDTLGLSSKEVREFERLDDLYGQATVKAVALAQAERMRLISLSEQTKFQIGNNALQVEAAQRTAGSLDQFTRRFSALYLQSDLEKASIRHQFDYIDNLGVIHHATGAQVAQMQTLLDQHEAISLVQVNELLQAKELADAAYKRAVATAVAGSGGTFSDSTVGDRYQAKVDEINAEADLDLKAGHNAVEVERKKQAEIRQLRRGTILAAADDAKTITDVLLASGSRDVKAVGHAADAVRRVLIGAQAAHAAVEAAIEGGKAIGAAASGNWAGAALHAASALELTKAAALGAQESLGGGTSGAGGGGASGGGGSSTTFEPRSGTEGQGMVTINLLTQNPYGAEQIQQVQYQLQRADILKRPIPISPTNQLRGA
jgi:hypothetical protein